VIEQGSGTDVRAWRPQPYSRANFRKIADPVIEPVWIGERVLVHVENRNVRLVGEDGETVEAADGELADVRQALESGVLSWSAVFDGYLTRQATQRPTRRVAEFKTPTAGEVTTGLFIGHHRNPRKELSEDDEHAAAIMESEDLLAFVAVDLLEIDGTPLLDVPLLERKRLLGGAIDESLLLRVGPYVREPAERWFGAWRVAGFIEIAYKAANGRYHPGVAANDWATVRLPKR
jgi:ATP-dependent DNA ligase